MERDIVVLHGFRATGKSTIGPQLAEKLGYNYVEIDFLIEQRAGMTIPELTKDGTDWQPFRQMEQDILRELMDKEKIVVSTGGGTCVNGVVKNGTESTFGQQNAEIVQQNARAISILIQAGIEVVLKRITEQELKKAETTRPILNEQRAREVQAELDQYTGDHDAQKRILVEAIVKDNINMYEARQPLYAALTPHVVDTTDATVEEAVRLALEIVRSANNT